MRSPAPGNASPRTSLSTPAMIRRSVDLPAPLAPRTPILAPWKNDSQIPCRISRLGGTTLRRSFITNAYSPAIVHGAPETGSPYPSFLTLFPCAVSLRGFLTRFPCSVFLGGAEQPAVLGHHAAVLHHADARAREPLGRRVVPDAELEPHDARPPPEREDLVGVRRQVLRTPEDLDDVGGPGEVGHARHGRRIVEEPSREPGVHREDPGTARAGGGGRE